MTNKLPQETQEAIDNIISDYKKQCGSLYFSQPWMAEILQKHLSLPKQEDTKPIEQLEARVKYIEDTIHKIIDNNLKIRKKLNVLIEDYNKR